jgi:hypothetical protein
VEPLRMGRDDAAVPSRVLVRFSDDEILEGDAVSLDLDRPDFELVLADPGANSRRALIPLPSVKCVTFERRAIDPAALDDMQKVALHFNDGEVITGLLGETRRGRYGVQLELVNREGDHVELLGIPYDSLKAMFFLQAWEGPHDDDAVLQMESQSLVTPLVDLLGELRDLADLRDRGDIDDIEFVSRRRAVLDLI